MLRRDPGDTLITQTALHGVQEARPHTLPIVRVINCHLMKKPNVPVTFQNTKTAGLNLKNQVADQYATFIKRPQRRHIVITDEGAQKRHLLFI